MASTPTPTSTASDPNTRKRKPYETKKKRLRTLFDPSTSAFDDRPLLVDRCRRDIADLCDFFHNSLAPRLPLDVLNCRSQQASIACLVEGSALPLAELADEVYAQLAAAGGVTVQSILTDLPFIGSRIKYGVDDESGNEQQCLWCWEVREVSVLPKSLRGLVKFLRATRKKVHSRIAALSVTIATILNLENPDEYKSVLLKASERLARESNLDDLHASMQRFVEKRNTTIAPKETNVNEGQTKENVEKGGKKDQEIQKEKLQHEKELKRLKDEAIREERKHEKEEMELKKRLKREQDEAEKKEKKREKEESELKKRLKRQQDEAEKEQKRREKEEAETKKQASLRKQATLMEKFLKRTNDNITSNQCADLSTKVLLPQIVPENVDAVQSVTSSVDSALSHLTMYNGEDLRKHHLAVWRGLCLVNSSKRWGIRSKPKLELVKEIRLQGPSPATWCSQKVGVSTKEQPCIPAKFDDSNLAKGSDEVEENLVCDLDPQNDNNTRHTNRQTLKRIMKLLQFDKSPRPAYYGTWSKKSAFIGPRHPSRKDPELDYDVESDEEWEEEEPGESLTDCEKDEEDVEDAKGELKEESEDSFVVPDGYLSENEGAEMDMQTSDAMNDEATSMASSQQEVESEELRMLLQHIKYLNSLTEKALSKSQPLIISNLMHEKSDLMKTGDLHGVAKIESTCLQALCMQVCPGGAVVEFSMDNPVDMVEEVCPSQCRIDASPAAASQLIPDSNLPEIVRTIQSCSQSIGKVVEVLQQKFPAFSKTQIKNKVREVAEFVDNRWKVKKEVLHSLGMSPSPDGSKKKSRGIATFFSKRCLPPPTVGEVCAADSSPVLKKHKTVVDMDADQPSMT